MAPMIPSNTSGTIQSINIVPNRSLLHPQDRQRSIQFAVGAIDTATPHGSLSGFSYLRQHNHTGTSRLRTIDSMQCFENLRHANQKRLRKCHALEPGQDKERRLARITSRFEKFDAAENFLEANPHKHVLGSVGWGKDCLIRLPKGHNVNQYDALLLRDSRTKELSTLYFNNLSLKRAEDIHKNKNQANEKRKPSGSGKRASTSLAFHAESLTTLNGSTINLNTTHTPNEESRDATTHHAGNSDSAGCCIKMNLDEAAIGFSGEKDATIHSTGIDPHQEMAGHLPTSEQPSSTTPNTHHHSGEAFELPQTALDFSLAGLVTYLSLAGAYISLKTIRGHHKKLVQEICETIDKTYRELNVLSILPPDTDPDLHAEKIREKQAKILFCCRQLRESLFQLHAAGHLSGGASIAMLLGQVSFVPGIQTLALGANAMVGAAHIGNSIRNLATAITDQSPTAVNLSLYEKIKHAVECHSFQPSDEANQPNEVTLAQNVDAPKSTAVANQSYRRKAWTNLKNVASWLTFTAGVSAVTVTMLAAIGLAVSFPPMLIPISLTLLIVGIGAVLKYNNRLTGNQFNPGLPLKIVNSTPSESLVRQELERAGDHREQTRILTQQAKWRRPLLSPLRHQWNRFWHYKLATIASVGIATPALMERKSGVKQLRVENTVIPDKAVTGYLAHFLSLDASPPTQTSHSSAIHWHNILQTEDEDVPGMSANRLTPHIAKLISHLALKEVETSTRWVRTDWRQGFFKRERTFDLQLKDSYQHFFDNADNPSQVLTSLKALRTAKPCCVEVFPAQEVMTSIKLDTKEHQKMFEEIIKRYSLFQAKKDAVRDINLWSEYLACFKKTPKVD